MASAAKGLPQAAHHDEANQAEFSEPEVGYVEPLIPRRRPGLAWRPSDRRGGRPNAMELTRHHQPVPEEQPQELPAPTEPLSLDAHRRALQQGPEDSFQAEFMQLVPQACLEDPERAAHVLAGLHALYLSETGRWTESERHALLDRSLGELLLGMPALPFPDLHRLWWAGLQRVRSCLKRREWIQRQ